MSGIPFNLIFDAVTSGVRAYFALVLLSGAGMRVEDCVAQVVSIRERGKESRCHG